MSYDPAPGMRVVCIDASHTNPSDTPEIVEGHVYTIAAIEVSDVLLIMAGMPRGGDIGVHLVEITDRYEPLIGRQMPFAASRFKPIDERKLDVFREHLTTIPKHESGDGMTTLVLALASFAAGIITGAAALYRLRDRVGRKRPPQGFSRDMSWPGRGIHIIDASDADHLDAALRGDV